MVLVCRDRYWMLVACLAVWSRGAVVVLPPNLEAGTTSEVAAASRAVAVVRDTPRASSTGCFDLALSPALAADDAPPLTAFEIAAEAEVALLYTSGTTGTHQPCMKRARQLFGEAEVLAATFGFDRESVVVSTVPVHHLYGLLFSLLGPYLAGGCFSRETPLHPPEVLRLVIRARATTLISVPAHLRVLAASDQCAPSTLTQIFSSGAPLPADLARTLVGSTGTRIIDVLGSTESGGIGYREPALVERYRPLPGVEIDATDAGRLLLRSPFLEVPSTWQPAHDRIELVPGGFSFQGRDDGVIKVAGKRVAVQEVEQRARALPAVDDAVCLVVPNERRGSELWLAVATHDPRWSPDRLRVALAAHFDPAVLPRRYRVVASLPRNALGKLTRDAIRALFDGQANGVG